MHHEHCVDLGFAEARLPAGTHICQIYSEAEERDHALREYLLRGLQTGERSACFSENITEEELGSYFAEFGISLSEAKKSGAFTLAPTSSVYFHDNRFEPERMLGLLERYHQQSMDEGYSGARVIGEMSPEIENVEGGSRLLEYESRVSMLLRQHPVTAVCQYNAHDFDGGTIMEVLKVHPMMIVRGSVVHNPFFIPPEEYLKLNQTT